MNKRLVDRLKLEQKVANDNIEFAINKPLSYECLFDLTTEHTEIGKKLQLALDLRTRYLIKQYTCKTKRDSAYKLNQQINMQLGIEDDYL